MADFSDFTSLVSNFVPNVPPFVVARAAQQISQDFFGRTTELQETLTVTTVIGQKDYTLTPTIADTFVNLVLCVEDENGYGMAHSQTGNTLMVSPIPTRVQDIKVKVALTPNIEATEIPDNVFYRHTNALRYGTIAILKSQTATEWYSPAEAANYLTLYEQEINQSKILQLSANNNLTMQINKFDL